MKILQVGLQLYLNKYTKFEKSIQISSDIKPLIKSCINDINKNLALLV